jgi:hypothetical protein
MDNNKIYSEVKAAFCSLVDFKVRGNTLEIITPFATLSSKIVSVFITEREGKLIVSDGGWINENIYNEDETENDDDVLNKIFLANESFYKIKTTLDKNKIEVYYKVCENPKLIANATFEMASFITSIVDSKAIPFKKDRESIERLKFRTEVDNFLESICNPTELVLRRVLDIPGVTFNAIIRRHSKIYLFNYVTGSSPYHFEKELQRNYYNFDVIRRSTLKHDIEGKACIINTEATGYRRDKFGQIIKDIQDKVADTNPTNGVIEWKSKNRIKEMID